MGKDDRGPSAGINERLGALERELLGLERMLEEDESWRALAAAGVRPGAKTSMLSRLHKALEANPIYQARAKLLEAMSLLSEPSQPTQSAPQPPAGRIAAATRGKAATRGVTEPPLPPTQPPPLRSNQPPPLPSAQPPPLPSSAAGGEGRYAPPLEVEEAEVVIVTRDSLLPALVEETAAETEVAAPSERSLRRRLAAAREPEGFDGDAYAGYSGSIEEASVMIISAAEIAARPEEAAPAQQARPGRRRATIIKRD